jgi:hypothetical protein
LPINILQNLNVERNLVEHEYITPEPKRVTEAVEVAQLLLLALERLLESTPLEMAIGWRNPNRHTLLRIEPARGELEFRTLRAPGKYRRFHGINIFSGPLRTEGASRLAAGITVAQRPWKIIELTRAKMNEWSAILSEVVSLQRGGGLPIDLGRSLDGFITTRVTFPLNDYCGSSLSELTVHQMASRFDRKKETHRTPSSGPESPVPSDRGGSRASDQQPPHGPVTFNQESHPRV